MCVCVKCACKTIGVIRHGNPEAISVAESCLRLCPARRPIAACVLQMPFIEKANGLLPQEFASRTAEAQEIQKRSVTHQLRSRLLKNAHAISCASVAVEMLWKNPQAISYASVAVEIV